MIKKSFEVKCKTFSLVLMQLFRLKKQKSKNISDIIFKDKLVVQF